MPKGNFFNDTFEKVAELGGSTVKQTTNVVKQVVNPQKALEQVTGITDRSEEDVKREAEKKKASTPLDLEKLDQKYIQQDKQKEEILRNRLFQLVKQSERELLDDEKRKKQEDGQREAQELEQKKKQEEEQRQQQESGDAAPKGKERKSIFSRKKKQPSINPENKPSGSKF